MAENFQAAARDRWLDAQVLLARRRWSGAVYLARFSLECLLKARLQVAAGVTRPRSFQHNLLALARHQFDARVLQPILLDLQEVDSIEVSIRYNTRVLGPDEARRLIAMINNLRRWVRRRFKFRP